MERSLAARRVVVGSGWWSSPAPNPWNIGDPITRSPEFFGLWLHLVQRYIEPAAIVVVDSASPRKPPAKLRAAATWIELDANHGHANDLCTGLHPGKLAGVTRAIVLAATFALCDDADIFCYVEQGCLVRGDGFIAGALAGRPPGIMFGAPTRDGRGLHGGPAAAMHQMSVILVGRASIPRFVNALLTAPESDGDMSPEIKLARYCAPFEELALPFGRSRPIDFTVPAFYIKHATTEELQQFCRVEGIRAGYFGLPAAYDSECDPFP
jgi:hypothetical protein